MHQKWRFRLGRRLYILGRTLSVKVSVNARHHPVVPPTKINKKGGKWELAGLKSQVRPIYPSMHGEAVASERID
jgi:hypothetical protein